MAEDPKNLKGWWGLWVTPRKSDWNMQKLVDELATEMNGPKFQPHQTILGSVKDLGFDEMCKVAERVAAKFAVQQAELRSITLGSIDYKFQCVYGDAHPIDLLTEMHDMAVNLAYNQRGLAYSGRLYHPHMSLYYGDDFVQDDVRLPTLQRVLNEHFGPVDMAELVTKRTTPLNNPFKFDIAAIDVVWCPLDTIDEWVIGRSFALTG